MLPLLSELVVVIILVKGYSAIDQSSENRSLLLLDHGLLLEPLLDQIISRLKHPRASVWIEWFEEIVARFRLLLNFGNVQSIGRVYLLVVVLVHYY